MPKTKAQAAARDKHDAAHYKYQSIKFRIDEHERLQKAVSASDKSLNGFCRAAIMQEVDWVLSDYEKRENENNV